MSINLVSVALFIFCLLNYIFEVTYFEFYYCVSCRHGIYDDW